jgi:hypothetical protein
MAPVEKVTGLIRRFGRGKADFEEHRERPTYP